jgi:hypothetical protein
MSQHRPVPRLDLAPKLKRPLSLWNPFDYLRLLYWVFFFPQALRWYVDTFGDFMDIFEVWYIPLPQRNINWRNRWKWLRRNHILRQFLLQALVLIVVTSLTVGVIVQRTSISFDWSGVVFGGTHSISVRWTGSVVIGRLFSVLLSALLIAWVISWTFGMQFDLWFILACHRGIGVRLGVLVGILFSFTATWSGTGSALFITLHRLAFSLLFGVLFSVVVSVAILRPENWLIGLPLILLKPRNRCWQLAHVTLFPLPSVTSQLKDWLRRDWEAGLYNVNQLLTYTLQLLPVVQVINQVLAETPSELVISLVAQLAEAPYGSRLVYFASASVREQIKSPAQAAAAGFWHLYLEEPEEAAEAFSVVRSLPHGEEMFTLAQTLANLQEVKEPAAIAALEVPIPEKKTLRPASWKVIKNLHLAAGFVQLSQCRVSAYTRYIAKELGSRKLSQLIDLLKKGDSLPQAERRLILGIALAWLRPLIEVLCQERKISITEPVQNPYVVGDPVQGHFFYGREDVLKQLEELWVMGNQLQSVVLYGHRRMGKTSILLNAADYLGEQVQIAYVNLLRLGDSPQGVAEVLMAISDAIAEAVGCTPPEDVDLLNLPYRTFERYLKQVEVNLDGGLIIALDEFEKIEELIEAEKIPKDFMGFLRGLVQMSPTVAFAFAGLHTLEEMTADYFQPFFASVIPIHVGFLEPKATELILAYPYFPLDHTSETVERIYALTSGQPYLVQLVGFQLVRRYNDFAFEQGRPRDPVFTVEDVEAVINDPEFFKRGRYYFDGVWGQAARGASGQQAILRALAPRPDGLTIDALAQVTGMDEETLQEALKTLTRHDVVREREGCWQIIVELFRRWVLQS